MGAPRSVAVVATAQTELRSAWSNAQHVDLISSTVMRLLRIAGIGLADVDFVIDSGSDVLDGRSISNCGFLGAMGAHHKEESRVEEDGLWAATYGATKIAAGAAEIGLIIAYSKPSESDVSLFYASQVEPFYQRPVGFDHLAASGLQAQQYIRMGGSEADFAKVTARAWEQAAQNPFVDIEAAPSEQEIASGEMVAAPLRRHMMARSVDGCVAVLLAGAEVARGMSSQPVWITGMGSAMDNHAFPVRKPGRLEACEAAARAAYNRAGLDPRSASIAEVSGSSAAGELMVLEALGLSKPGQGFDTYSGPTAINLSGGALPADPIMATGLLRLADAHRQLTQPKVFGLASPETAIVHAAGGVGMQTHCVVTLGV
ncbi:thiolase C-terminal domain-containing protein [Enterovirga aerilata]|uniref:3-ketoacyl-CoA thiolase n=1 Tax=Enterovirga aerilata TaxID=2730920 RepID=A0A849IJL8_9HYPH|nr:3-ketoacyl-CoA thiolase [Enterovirga sp. DB1703]NNM74133.1 3-ketoacyl-CoA thiolase [Enterovirga sp. DB1703]